MRKRLGFVVVLAVIMVMTCVMFPGQAKAQTLEEDLTQASKERQIYAKQLQKLQQQEEKLQQQGEILAAKIIRMDGIVYYIQTRIVIEKAEEAVAGAAVGAKVGTEIVEESPQEVVEE